MSNWATTEKYEPFESEDEARDARPKSLTYERAESLIPRYFNDPWPAERMTREEAVYIMRLIETGSWRWMACMVLGDSNQVYGSWLIQAANLVLRPPGEKGSE